jgi:hypothetical protein
MFKSDIYPEHESSRKDRRKAFFCKIIDCSATSILTVKYDVFTLYVLIIVKAVMHLGWFMASSNAILKSTPLMITHDKDKRTNNDVQYTTLKTKNRITRTSVH